MAAAAAAAPPGRGGPAPAVEQLGDKLSFLAPSPAKPPPATPSEEKRDAGKGASSRGDGGKGSKADGFKGGKEDSWKGGKGSSWKGGKADGRKGSKADGWKGGKGLSPPPLPEPEPEPLEELVVQRNEKELLGARFSGTVLKMVTSPYGPVGRAAGAAGFVGRRIVSINGTKVEDTADIKKALEAGGKDLTFTFAHAEKAEEAPVADAGPSCGHPYIRAFPDEEQPSCAPGKAPRWVFVMMGQSNMSGRGTCSGQDYAVPPEAWKLDAAGVWKAAFEPVTPHDGRGQGVGPGLAFAKALAVARPGCAVLLAPCAVGSTELREWMPGEPLYDAAVRRAKAGAAAAGAEIAGVLWHQGEGDAAKDAEAATYEPRLGAFIRQLRADLGAPDIPFVCGALGESFLERSTFPAHRNAAHVNRALAGACRAAGGAGCVAAADTCMPDALHFDAAGQRLMGERYAAEWTRLARAVPRLRAGLEQRAKPAPAAAPAAPSALGRGVLDLTPSFVAAAAEKISSALGFAADADDDPASPAADAAAAAPAADAAASPAPGVRRVVRKVVKRRADAGAAGGKRPRQE